MAKKHNKSRKQKPNYSKRGIPNANVEAADVDFELEKKPKDSSCISTDCISERNIKKR